MKNMKNNQKNLFKYQILEINFNKEYLLPKNKKK